MEKSEFFKLDHLTFSLGFSLIPRAFYMNINKLMSLLNRNVFTWDFIDGYCINSINRNNLAKKNPLEALEFIETFGLTTVYNLDQYIHVFLDKFNLIILFKLSNHFFYQ